MTTAATATNNKSSNARSGSNAASKALNAEQAAKRIADSGGKVTTETVRGVLKSKGLAEDRIRAFVAEVNQHLEALVSSHEDAGLATLDDLDAAVGTTCTHQQSQRGNHFVEFSIPGARLGRSAWVHPEIVRALLTDKQAQDEARRVMDVIDGDPKKSASK